jgi:hypothetical protein
MLVLAMQFSKMQPRREPSHGGGMEDPEQSSTDDHPICRFRERSEPARFGDVHGSLPLPQNRAVKTGGHEVSVVPVTARRMISPRGAKSAGWYTGVEVVRETHIGQCST